VRELCFTWFFGLGETVPDQNNQKNTASHPAPKQGSKPVLYLPLPPQSQFLNIPVAAHNPSSAPRRNKH
jgi:hypothetical protein